MTEENHVRDNFLINWRFCVFNDVCDRSGFVCFISLRLEICSRTPQTWLQNMLLFVDNMPTQFFCLTGIERFIRMKSSIIRNIRRTTELSTKWLWLKIIVQISDKFSLAFHDLLYTFTATKFDSLISFCWEG